MVAFRREWLEGMVAGSFKAFCGMAWLLLAACAGTPADQAPQEGEKLLTEEEEIKFGYYVDQAITDEFIVLKNARLTGQIEVIGRRLVAVSHRSELPFTFRVLNDEMVNAFAGPGGFVYVTTGLLDIFESKDELAAVLAHEIGHVTAKHSLRALINAQRAQGALFIVNIVGALASAVTGAPAGDLTNAVGYVTTLMVYQGYSRSFESQSDRLGLRYMSQAGFDPEAMVTVFEKFIKHEEEKDLKKAPTILSSHPGMEERIEEVKAVIEGEGLKDVYKKAASR
jgi:predicted Zn-dependent protease